MTPPPPPATSPAPADPAAAGLAFLAEAGQLLASSLDHATTLANVARLTVPTLADWCAVDVLEEDGRLQRLAVVHTDPDRVELARDLFRRYPPDPKEPHGVWEVIRTGRPELYPDIPDALLEARSRGAELLAILRRLGLRSAMLVPLLARGRGLGAITLVSAESGRHYGPADLTLAEDLAGRCALALDNARLYRAAQAAEQRYRDRAAALEEAARHKDAFLAVLAHELRNPLAPVRNALHVLRARGGDGATRAWAQGVLERQVGHLSRLLDDLLDVSRLTRGKIALKRERVDLAQLIRVAVEDHRTALSTAGLTLELDLPPTPVWVEGDSTRLAQVLDNLLSNAAKFTPPGGRVTVRLQGGADARVTVRDTGVGIARDLLPHLFQTMTQADSSLERTQGGLGLGLALVKGLVDLHGGRAEAHSAGLGQGAEFVVALPLERGGTVAGAAAPVGPPQGQPLRILMVEDHRDGAETLQALLQLAGHEVALACTGPEGVSLAHEFHPDVVLCDIGLPGMDGFAVGRALRQDPVTARSRLIVLSGYGQEEDRRKSREAGFDLHLTKPVDPTELQRLLRAQPVGGGRTK